MSALYQSSYVSPIGQITIVAHDTALVGLWFDGQKYFAQSLHGQTLAIQETPILRQTKLWLDAYFSGQNPTTSCHISLGLLSSQESDKTTTSHLPLDPRGTKFQCAVWRVLLQIPYGQTTTYGAIARQIATQLGKPTMSAQAVGNAVGRNPISLIIPCHRVVSQAGNLTGYAGGLGKKKFLLDLEHSKSHQST